MARPTLADVAIDLLLDHPARTSAEIAAEAVVRRATKAKDPAASVRRALGEDLRFVPVTPDTWVLHARVAAFPLTHRVTPEETAAGTLGLGLDLGTIPSLVPAGVVTSDGTRLQVLRGRTATVATGVDAGAALRGPQGWPGFAAGTLVAVSMAGQAMSVREAPEPSAAGRMRGRRLLAITRDELSRIDAEDPGGPFIGVLELIAALIAAGDSAEAGTLPPLSEVYEGSGLVAHHGWVGLPHTDWAAIDDLISRMRRILADEALGDPLDDDDDEIDDGGTDAPGVDGADEPPGFDDRTLDGLVDQHDLEGSEAKALGLVLDLFVVWDVPGRDGTPPSASVAMRRKLADLVGIPRMAFALADYASTDPRFERFAADLWASTVGRPEGAGPAYLLGSIAESHGDVALAERRYREALALDRWCVPADLGLLSFEIDRGDYPAALARMRRLEFPEDEPERRWVASLVGPALPKAGRNDPCPCGSGRKYKACHLDRPAVAGDIDPLAALQRKVGRFMLRPDAERALEALVHEALGFADASDENVADLHEDPWITDAEARLLDDNPDVVLDVLLAERGWLRRFLDLRGSLLPSAERELAQSWIDTRLRLYEVVSTAPGNGLVLRDIDADALPVDVRDRSLSRSVQPLDLVLLRLRPDGRGGMAPSDGVLVPRGDRSAVARLVGKGDTLGLLRFIALPKAPPRMQNMDGDPIRLVTATYRLPDAAGARRTLAIHLEEQEPGQFAATTDRKGRAWSQGTITIDGDVATIDANSSARADALAKRLLAAAPGAQLIERREQSIEAAIAKLEGAGGGEPGGGPRGRGGAGPLAGLPDDLANSPEVRALLDETVRRFESDWVDESIPALGGRTPRAAIRTPRGRREVEALLDDMAWMRRRAGEDGAAGMMDADRIRELLGLSRKPG